MSGSVANERVYEAMQTSRQAVHQYLSHRHSYLQRVAEAEATLLLHRKEHPGLGLVKAYGQIQPTGLGRDRFVFEMTRRGHALPLKRNYVRTTRSDGYRFPNLIKGLVINGVNLVWQSDTTYFRIGEKWYYITFIIDVYSRLIIGHHVNTTLAATANVAALKMALKNRAGADLSQLIFHSDGGTQYRYKPFVELLRSHGISSSMCSAATDNAYAEKLNDVIKNEYLVYLHAAILKELRRILNRSVKNYNTKRHHGQLPRPMTPADYEKWLDSADSSGKRSLQLIRDGQAPASDWQPDVCGSNLVDPVARATKGVYQILPAHVLLDLPTEDRQLAIPFN
jgi:transposase InsO family protein